MVRIAWRMVRQRPANLIATFLALWFAVAMVTTCGAMLESGLRFHGTVARYAAAPVLVATTDVSVVTGSGDNRDENSQPLPQHGRLSPSLPDRIAAAPGVRRVVSDVAMPSRLLTARGAAATEVHPWSAAALAPFTLRSGHAPAAAGDAVLDEAIASAAGARIGQQVRVQSATGVRTLTVAGIAAPTGHAPRTSSVFVDDGTARTLSGGSPQVIAVLPDDGVSVGAVAASVRTSLPEQDAGANPHVFVGADRGSVESPDVDGGRQFVVILSSVFGGSTLLIAVFVIVSTVGLSVRQRRRDIALLRAIAATPRQVRRLVVREAWAVWLLAAACGVWPGLAAARWLRDRFVGRGLTPDTFRTHLSWLPPVAASTAALLVTVVAAWVASLRASRIPPTDALAETTVEPRGAGVVRALVGVLALAGGIVLCAVSVSVGDANAAAVSIGTVATLATATALLSPLLIRAVAASAGRALRLFGVPGRLAVANVATSAQRLSPVIGSVVLAVALGGSLSFLFTSEQHAAKEQAHAAIRADYVVTSPAPGVPGPVVTALRRVDGVRAVTGVTRGSMLSGSDVAEYSAEGIDSAGAAQTLDLGVTAGSLTQLRGNTAAVDALTADELGLHVGGRFAGWFADGLPTGLRVVAIYDRGLGTAQLTVPRALLARHTESGMDDAVLVAAGPSVLPAIREVVARAAPFAVVQARADYRTGLDRQVVQSAWANRVIVVVLLVYVAIAAVNTLVMYALQRRREFGILRLAGTTLRQLRRMAWLEQVLVLGVALAVGTASAAAALIPMVKGVTGSATPYVPATGWLTAIAAVLGLGVVATVFPVRRTLRVRAIDAVGARE